MANFVKTLGDFAFENLIGLKEIVWSTNVEAIGERALAGCKSLGERFGPTNFIPPSCTYIGPRAFRDIHRLDTIIIPANTEVHPTTFQGSKIWTSSPFNEDGDDSCLLVDWIKFHQHDNYPLHAIFAKTQINSTDIICRLCTDEEHLYSDIGKRLYNDKDRFGRTPMDYLNANPYAEKFDEMVLVRARILRLMKIDGIEN
ncbi:leucine-rich repeat domain-containing protein [Chaetoceros tenuissimus]|uniref:Leucine-rich repeat domain-containing protein n=1 Tax=Chaetoceros tenuissimus TaxID=426638 RepID=A0AAD3CS63_9STRA|nr:leucine-rich repeat domain-containing protein [Chaetoceros tenuissimus]